MHFITRSVVALASATALAGAGFVGGAAATAGAASSPTPSAVGDSSTCTKYPLDYSHYYARNDGTGRSHSGTNSTDRRNIMRIQNALNASIAAELDVDGYFGPATETATKQLQQVLNDLNGKPFLVVDGKFGKHTFFATSDFGWGSYLCGW